MDESHSCRYMQGLSLPGGGGNREKLSNYMYNVISVKDTKYSIVEAFLLKSRGGWKRSCAL